MRQWVGRTEVAVEDSLKSCCHILDDRCDTIEFVLGNVELPRLGRLFDGHGSLFLFQREPYSLQC